MFSKRWMLLGLFPWIHGCELYLGAGEGILWECPAVSDACVCGDNRVSPELGEVCDDGNASDFDGWSSSCSVETVVSIVAGAWHTCALTDGGAVKCWGDNRYGQLGLGDRENRGDAPSELTASGSVVLGKLDRAVAIAAGEFHTCVLLDDGRVKCWGLNGVGQLGLGDVEPRGLKTSRMGDALPEVAISKQVSAGDSHTCVVTWAGTVKCRGWNEFGQLGQGTTENVGDQPGEVETLSDVNLGTDKVKMVATGQTHTCALLEDAGVVCWGGNASGQLGAGDTKTRGRLRLFRTCAVRCSHFILDTPAIGLFASSSTPWEGRRTKIEPGKTVVRMAK